MDREDDPFARLEQTHRRLEERLDELAGAAEAIAAGDRVDDAIACVEDAIGFLGRGGVRHVEDEERSLFPRLRQIPELAGLLRKLEEEHREHEAVEKELRAAAEPLHRGPPDAAAAAALVEIANRLCKVYGAHIRTEENELFPRARQLLDRDVQREMAAEMSGRRR